MKKVTVFEGGRHPWTPEELGYDPELHWSIGQVIEVPERLVKKDQEVKGESFYVYRIDEFVSDVRDGTVAKLTYLYFTPF